MFVRPLINSILITAGKFHKKYSTAISKFDAPHYAFFIHTAGYANKYLESRRLIGALRASSARLPDPPQSIGFRSRRRVRTTRVLHETRLILDLQGKRARKVDDRERERPPGFAKIKKKAQG